MEKVVLAEFLEFGAGGGGDVAADDEDGEIGPAEADDLEHFGAGGSGHVEIEQYRVEGAGEIGRAHV